MTWTNEDKALLRTACAEGARWALTLPNAEAVIRSTEHPDWSAWLIRRWVEAGRALPDGLSVGGWLYLGGCTGLTALPDGLSVGGWLYLGGCTGLTALPDGLSVGRDLDLRGCTGLTALPDGLSVGRDLDLRGCTRLGVDAMFSSVDAARAALALAKGE